MDCVSKILAACSRRAQSGFEGAEKRLEIDLRGYGSMRTLTREFWDNIMEVLHAQIVDAFHGQELDSYILTESSLFVYDLRIVLITCGTTVLLNCLPNLMRGVADMGLDVEWMAYSRKNFMFPAEQPSPHSSVSEEFSLLHTTFPDGHAFILGPLDSDNYFIFLMDKIERPGKLEVDQQLNLIMYDMPESVAKNFYSTEQSCNSALTQSLRQVTGLEGLFGEYKVQDLLFTPCGYSANAVQGPWYCTTHVTPEQHCSYASFETNMSVASYQSTIEAVLTIYQPQRFTSIILLDELSEGGKARAAGLPIGAEAFVGYRMTNRTVNEFEPGYYTLKCNYCKV
eukprot:TRINITY_DN10803_c0_g1_i1.p1 TRINITY_DN10803_c0_g1~~TRINITY_DN10803_c0_g1_i1.p1  ORF type:complete len:351 (+),score=29.35 TRINITY_DN10803_c0_g1_i1:34-1053(+)